MIRWKLTGTIATLIILLIPPIYLLKESDRPPVKTLTADTAFVGTAACTDCHRQEYNLWKNSDHANAMAVATEKTVRGNFNDGVFSHFDITSRFYRKNGKFYVHTQGPDGRMGDFEVTHTFGWYPLQQYLVPFPGGRLQCLPIAWDVEKKRWYHLYPEEPIDPDDWLYWTNAAQNWNGMCAECHSTNLKKNYHPETATYTTTWKDINVGCEACHGPGSGHVEWAKMPEMGRPSVENAALHVVTGELTSRQQIELCAPCHSRRMSLGDNRHRNIDFLDYAVPQLLGEGYYFPDGQILEEVYVYGSFMQSKMYARDVRCSDCHDVHSTRRIKEGNDLCLQCHKAAVYDTAKHHFHKKAGETGDPIRSDSGEILFQVGTGASREQCHMPGRTYMGIDYRPDHSFRIPRPDLSLTLDTPNACNRCHQDKPIQWSVDAMAKWYGKRARPHYGTVLDAGRRQAPEAVKDLVNLVDDRLYPAIVRATALSLLASYPGKESQEAFLRALGDEEALLRYTALRYLADVLPEQRFQATMPLLYDPVFSVRIEAAQNMAAAPTEQMPPDMKERLDRLLTEYRQAMEYTADFSPSRHNLGNLYAALGRVDKAMEQYQKAVEIDREFYPAKVNLAMLYNRQGENAKAEQLLREVVAQQPELYEIHYSLGLLLAEEKKYAEAADYLQTAAEGLPQRGRIQYNLGLLRQQMGQDLPAEQALAKAIALEPGNLDFLYAMADFYLKRGRFDDARPIAEQMVHYHPNQRIGHEILGFIQKRTGS